MLIGPVTLTLSCGAMIVVAVVIVTGQFSQPLHIKFAVCKDSYVIYAYGFDRMEK